MKRLGLADSAHCECGSEGQTPEHILQTCPQLETVHQHFWPEDIGSGHQALGASWRTTVDDGLPSNHQPEDLARSSHRTQKKKSYHYQNAPSFPQPLPMPWCHQNKNIVLQMISKRNQTLSEVTLKEQNKMLFFSTGFCEQETSCVNTSTYMHDVYHEYSTNTCMPSVCKGTHAFWHQTKSLSLSHTHTHTHTMSIQTHKHAHKRVHTHKKRDREREYTWLLFTDLH